MFLKNRKSVLVRMALALVLIASIISVVPTFASSSVIYVKWDTTSANNGSSWTDAYTDLQSALAVASSDDEIWVAAGTYKPTTGTDRNISFVLKNGVAIYGGFNGTETLRTQRDFETNVTILSGDIGVVDDKSDNSYHVMVASSVDNNTILDGVTITDGNANGVSPNDAGGGMYSDKGSLKLNNIIFTDNYATVQGGGLYTFYTDGEFQAVDLDLTGVVFSNNTTRGGGGGMATRFFPLLSRAFSVSLTNVTFTNNVAGRTGGGMSNEACGLTLLDVTFSGNTALGGGGLSDISFPDGPSTLTNVTFSNNSADEGGGGMLIGSEGGTLTTLTNVTFDHNSTAINGAGIVNAGYSDLILTNVTFSDNTAGANGGGIFNGEFAGVESGGTINLINTTFSHNVSNTNGSAIYNEIGIVNVRNSILYGDSGKEIYGTANVTYSIVQGGYIGIHNLDADPLLGPLQNNGGFTQTMALLPGSPAINAGDDSSCPETDQRAVTRPQGSHCDIGSVEYPSEIAGPRVVSITRANANPTIAPTVDFTVTFSEAVTGVDISDFQLTTSGVSGTSISGVSGTDNIYLVSVNVGNGNGTIRLDLVDDDSIQDKALNQLGGPGPGNGNFTFGDVYTVPKILNLNLNSIGGNDGWVLESSENSDIGGTVNATANNFVVGDDKTNKQYVGVLHFDTSNLPDMAIITSVILKVRKQDLSGADPFATHGGLLLNIQKPYFGTTSELVASDFQAAAGLSAVATFDPQSTNGWYSALVDGGGASYINLTGTTQFRLCFVLDDNNNKREDSVKFYSGDTAAANRPQLLIQYYIP